MMLIKNLGRHSLPPYKEPRSEIRKSKDKVGKVFSDRVVTHEIELDLFHLKDQLLAVVAFSCSVVLILLLGLLLC
jgi:hypothetical protein